ncbi:DUF1854 domain-containing protein [Quisquiliibacterium transsilvanicum]|jgi:hypothetical protein|uniref:DUF1854 domain-containing protein n=1 Tax=Quisquiliibacterium transsilvanicum TaxID=1549638 RepID=A0A7W8HK71_9BURK|nr:DUF1854 domain-containing protein [Quisquiliibacterium transsilvanicum]MBB5273572.1 hypothetical protein [Quisquiliibacterium transsilvanicum]
MTAHAFRLTRNSFGRLVLEMPDGSVHEAVVPVRAFPIGAPDDGLALVGSHGHELAWVDRLSDLAPATRALIEEELASREFMPEIRRIADVSGFVTPCTWEVETDRGPTRFLLRGEESIRRLPPPALLVADAHGIQYLIRDPQALDRRSRKLLDRFL